jgi:hypothetical protein
MPDLDDSDRQWKETERSLFWKFAQMDRDEYLRMYKDVLAEVVRTAEGDEAPKPAGEEYSDDDDTQEVEPTDEEAIEIEEDIEDFLD